MDPDNGEVNKRERKNADLPAKSSKGKDITPTPKQAKNENTDELATKEQVFEILELAKQKANFSDL